MALTILTIEKFSFDPLILVGLLAGLSLIGYLFFVKYFPLSDNCWKKTEIVLLVCSALGIGGLLSSNHKFFYEREQIDIGFKIDTYRHLFNNALDTTIYNRTFNTTLFSPENIMELENEYQTIYLWVKVNNPKILQYVYERQTICIDSLNIPQISDDILMKDIEYWKTLIAEYNKLVSDYQFYASNKNYNDIEIYYNVFYPIFFVLGLSYSIVRYIGEYCNSKKKNMRNTRNERI